MPGEVGGRRGISISAVADLKKPVSRATAASGVAPATRWRESGRQRALRILRTCPSCVPVIAAFGKVGHVQ